MENKTRLSKTRLAAAVVSLLRRARSRDSHLAREAAKPHPDVAFAVLIGTILSHRTKDERTEEASNALLSKFPTPKALATAAIPAITRLIRPVGFYHSKARYVKKCSQEIVGRFGGKVPRTMGELTSLTGVGRKTAGCVLVYAFGLPAIPVDSHVHQISNRLGLVKTKTPEETERALEKVVPRRLWVDVNELFVTHGQEVCVPVSPWCSQCVLDGLCPKVGVKKNR